jgi:long-chain fatty acid transport protein
MDFRRRDWSCAASLTALACATLGLAGEAQAGGFAVREQSAYYQGMSFAGAGTGDTLSSMYWNSAAAAAAPGMNTETHVSVILPDSEITATGGIAILDQPPGLGLGAESGAIADPAVVPASYANYQLTDQLFLGLAINSGFGLVTKPDNLWAGSPIAVTSDVFTLNVNPTIAYKLTPELTVGVGVQIEYLDVRLTNLSRSVEVDDLGFGFTAGASWTPVAGTTLGIGWRSAVDFDLEGDIARVGSLAADANAELTLPDIITIGLRQRLTEQLDVLVGYEWTNWSRLGTIRLDSAVDEELRLEFDDGHFVSLGLEYDYSPDTTLRFGVAWEKSPVSDEERNVFLPDSDRLWLSVGATHRFSDRISVDIGYTHIFADDARICRGVDGNPCVAGATFNLIEAEAESSVDIISASFKYKWGDPEPELEPLK